MNEKIQQTEPGKFQNIFVSFGKTNLVGLYRFFYVYPELRVRTQIILTAKEAYTYFKKLIQNSSYSECDPNLRTMKTFRSFLNFKSSPVLMAIVVLLLCLDLSLAKFTPLEIDNHPCTAEKLKVTFL